MNQSHPKISVITSVYNNESYLAESIQSILDQTLTDFEFIIINDASTDKSLNIIKSFPDPRIKVINNSKNLGLTKSLNLGLHQATGQYIARLDADDIAFPNRFKTQYNFMESNSDITLCGSNAELINETGTVIGSKKKTIDSLAIKFKIIFTNPFTHSSLFFRRDIVDKYNEEFIHSQDYELTSRLIKKHNLTNIPEVLIKHRLSDQSITGQPNSRRLQLTNALKISTANANQYLSLTSSQVKSIINTLNGSIISLKILLQSLKNYKKITHLFITKEELNKNQASKIISTYKSDRNQAFKRYLKNLIKPDKD